MHTTPASPSVHCRFGSALLAVTLLASLTLLTRLAAQPPSPSASAEARATISGRVFNPATGEYVRNAQILIPGTSVSTASEDGGVYELRNVPPGVVTVEVSFLGYRTVTAQVTTTAGQTATRDFEILSTAAPAASPTDPLKLTQFVVSAEREGNAKALMEQRNSMNISKIVTSDVFGDVSEGNVGEFLKYLPGVDVEYVEPDTRGPRLRGLDPQYTGVTIDGMRPGSADAYQQFAAGGSGNRSFGFEQASINSIESIEVNFTTSADQEANSPAGTINMKTKRAFDRKGRTFSWQANAMVNSEEMTLKRTPGPDDRSHYKIRPGGLLEVGDVFLGGRLGVLFSASESNMYAQQHRINSVYSTTPTATDPRPFVLTSLAFSDGPKFTERSSLTLTADFKATPRLYLGLTAVYNYYDAITTARIITFNATRASIPLAEDGVTKFSVNNQSVAFGGNAFDKITKTWTYTPKFEYKTRQWLLDGSASYSKSRNTYFGAQREIANATPVNNLAGVSYRAERTDARTMDWFVTQTAGPDISNLRNYTNPRLNFDTRFAQNEVYQVQLNAKYTTTWRIPTFFKTGGKLTEDYHVYDDTRPYYSYSYIGPGGGNSGSWVDFPGIVPVDVGDGRITGLGGRQVYLPDRNRTAELFNAHPEYFVNNSNAGNYYSAFIGNHKEIKERFQALYGMANTRLGKLAIQGGLRWEGTLTEAKQFDPFSRAKVVAAGYAVDTAGRATTVPGLNYQYGLGQFTRPQVKRSGRYDNLFPSASLRYSILPDLQAQLGYSHTISRPAFNDLAGIVSFNEDRFEITAPNPSLKPESGDNYSGRLVYYIKPVGSLELTAYENRVSDAAITDRLNAEEYGEPYANDPVYSTWDVITKRNRGGTTLYRGWSFAYSQSLDFLPGFWRGLGVNLNYTRTTSSVRRSGLTPHMIGGGFNYKHQRFNASINAKWTDDTPNSSSVAEGRYRLHRVMIDANAGLRLTRRLSLFVQARNIFNAPDYLYQDYDVNRSRIFEHYGAVITFGVKGSY